MQIAFIINNYIDEAFTEFIFGQKKKVSKKFLKALSDREIAHIDLDSYVFHCFINFFCNFCFYSYTLYFIVIVFLVLKVII